MRELIRDILNKKCNNKEKEQLLDALLDEIKIAKGVISGEYKYCPDCDDYYLAESYLVKTKTEETNICVYQDIINSGGNEYERGYVDITYTICPKGHKHDLSRQERRKR